jgi:hypothetical protein
MTDAWTPDAVNRLNRYLDEMRRQLSTQEGVNPDEVVDELRAHVHFELRDARAPVTAETLEPVLSSLGAAAESPAPARAVDWIPALIVFAMFVAGVLLFSYGPYLLILSAVAARAVLAREERDGLSGARMWLLVPPLVLLGAGVAAALLVAPVFPAGEILARQAGGSLTAGVGAAVGITLGLWWMLLAALVATGRRAVAWLAHPLPIDAARIARRLAVTGALVAVASAALFFFVR